MLCLFSFTACTFVPITQGLQKAPCLKRVQVNDIHTRIYKVVQHPFSYTHAKAHAHTHIHIHTRAQVGRDTEIGFILQRATNMVSGMATGGAIVIEGNTGERLGVGGWVARQQGNRLGCACAAWQKGWCHRYLGQHSCGCVGAFVSV